MDNVFVYRKPETRQKYIYTPKGIERLSFLINATLESRRWSVRELSRQCGNNPTPTTLGRYINGTIRNPRDGAIIAIAPYIFKPICFLADGVQINTSQVYSDWNELAIVGTDECTVPVIAGVEKKQRNSMDFLQKVRFAMQRNKISEVDLETNIQNSGFMQVDRLRLILSGSAAPTDAEKAIIATALDPHALVFDIFAWISDAQTAENPVHYAQEQNGFNLV